MRHEVSALSPQIGRERRSINRALIAAGMAPRATAVIRVFDDDDCSHGRHSTPRVTLAGTSAGGRRRYHPGARRPGLGAVAPCGDGHRRQFRRGIARRPCRRAALSGVAHQDDDPLHGVRADRVGKAVAVDQNQDQPGSGLGAADQARPGAGRADRRHRCDQGVDHQVRKRHGDRPGRGGRRVGSPLCRAHDTEGARARHARHDVPQCIGPA